MNEYQFLLQLDSDEIRGYEYAKKAYAKNSTQETIDTLYTQADGCVGDSFSERQFDRGISAFLRFNQMRSEYQPPWDF